MNRFLSKKNALVKFYCLVFTVLVSVCSAVELPNSPISLDPATKDYLEGFSKVFGSIAHLPLAEQRAVVKKMLKMNKSGLEAIEKVEDRAVSGREGLIDIRVFSPKSEGLLPIIVYYHGGGWVYGSVDQSEAICRRLANAMGAIVVSIEYRLSPEYKFPIPLQDCYDATKWVAKNANALLGDSNKLIVCGDSAGGNLAAAVALMAQEEKLFSIAGQLLIYPILTTDLEQEHYENSLDKSIISLKNMQFFINAYLSSPEDRNNPYVAPLKSKNLAGLPPCFIITAEHDALKYEGALYREALYKAGTQVQLKCYPGVIHGFLGFSMADAVKEEAMEDMRAWVNSL
jgi:acetyl esterase